MLLDAFHECPPLPLPGGQREYGLFAMDMPSFVSQILVHVPWVLSQM